MSTINWGVKNLWYKAEWQKICYSFLFKIIGCHVQKIQTKYMSLFDGPFKIFSAFRSLGQLSSRGLRWKLKFRPPCRNTYHYAVVERECHRRKTYQNSERIGLNLFVILVWFDEVLG